MDQKKISFITIYPADRNGSGFYRNFIPFRYLGSKFDTMIINELFQFNFDFNFIRICKHIRFQRQVSNAHKRVFQMYRTLIDKNKFSTKLSYDMDDLIHNIKPSNILAYQYYSNIRKKNLIEILKMCDFITVSTQYLKDYYEQHYGIKNIYVVKNFLPKYMWGMCGKRDKRNRGKKPRILWAGSASHIGKDGDLEFLLPLIENTLDEFEWVFFGVCPPTLENKVEKHNWENVLNFPQAIDAIDADVAIAPISDCEFNMAKSDLKLLEYAALNIPMICSSIGNKKGPYDLVPNFLTFENKVDIWYQAIKQTISDEQFREKLMKPAREELDRRWLENENNINQWKQLYQ